MSKYSEELSDFLRGNALGQKLILERIKAKFAESLTMSDFFPEHEDYDYLKSKKGESITVNYKVRNRRMFAVRVYLDYLDMCLDEALKGNIVSCGLFKLYVKKINNKYIANKIKRNKRVDLFKSSFNIYEVVLETHREIYSCRISYHDYSVLVDNVNNGKRYLS